MPRRASSTSFSDQSEEAPVTNKNSKAPLVVLLVLFVVAVAGFAWSYNNYRVAKKQLQSAEDPKKQQEEIKKENTELIEKVSKLIVLPTGEDPTIATVQDIEKLIKEQPFYEGAKNGDKLLVYMNAKKAFLYDPDRNILINVGPIYQQDANKEVKTSGSSNNINNVKGPLNLEIRNGSTTKGKGGLVSDEISQDKDYFVTIVGNAGSKTYEGNTLVTLNSNGREAEVEKLRAKYNAKLVTALPSGEQPSNADILLIIGN